jgi:hypothetical protein
MANSEVSVAELLSLDQTSLALVQAYFGLSLGRCCHILAGVDFGGETLSRWSVTWVGARSVLGLQGKLSSFLVRCDDSPNQLLRACSVSTVFVFPL